MEWIKPWFERLFGFVACLVPGSVGFLLIVIHRPDLVSKIWENQTLAYETKTLISLFFTFTVGFSATFLFSAVCSGLGGFVGEWLGPLEYGKQVPWESKHWRGLLRHYLGQNAPEDLEPPLSDEMFEFRLEAIKKLPPHEALQELAKLRSDEDLAYLNDNEWFAWWVRFHIKSLSAQNATAKMYETVKESFYVAAIIALVSMTFTPQLRLWWVIAICAFWLLHLGLTVASVGMTARDPWRSFQSQINYLQDRVERDKRLDELESETLD